MHHSFCLIIHLLLNEIKLHEFLQTPYLKTNIDNIEVITFGLEMKLLLNLKFHFLIM